MRTLRATIEAKLISLGENNSNLVIKSINIIGSGNVASFLALRLKDRVDIKSILVRGNDDLFTGDLTKDTIIISNFNDIPSADLTIIAVNDDSISAVAANLNKQIPIVHTSGSVSIETLSSFDKHGILYPLQTISKNRIVELDDFPFLIEANDTAFENELINFSTENLSDSSLVVDSRVRAQIHLAAVLCNNFSNYFMLKSQEVLEKTKIDFQILKPLMLETIEKAFLFGPENSQTGPAKRNDQEVILKQAEIIADPNLRELYLKISTLITKQFNS